MSDRRPAVPPEAFAALADAVFALTPRGTIASANGAAARLVGRELGDLVGRPFADICREPEHAARTMTRQAHTVGQELRREEVDLVDATGDAVPVSLVASAVLDDDGDLSAILVVARDVAAERRCRAVLEDELARTRDMALRAERLATLGTLAAAVGHELNNAATLLQCAVDQLQDTCGPPDDDTMQLLETALAHVTQYGKNLLRLARPGPVRPAFVDLNGLAAEVAELLRISGRTKYANVTCELEPGGASVTGVKTQLEQVLINLIANAADAVGELDRRPSVTVRVRARGACAELEVEDNGPGMAPEVLARVCEPFYTTKSAGRGTGLGLPIIRRIVEDHGGEFYLDSEAGAGTIARVRLPAHPTCLRAEAADAAPR